MMPSPTRQKQSSLFVGLALVLCLTPSLLATSPAEYRGEKLKPFPYAGLDNVNKAMDNAKSHTPSMSLRYQMASKPSPSPIKEIINTPLYNVPNVASLHIPAMRTEKDTFWYKLFHRGVKSEPAPIVSNQQRKAAPTAVAEIGSHTPSLTEIPTAIVVIPTILGSTINNGDVPIAMAVVSSVPASSHAPTVRSTSMDLPRAWFGRRPEPSQREAQLIKLIRYANPAYDDESAHKLANLLIKKSDDHNIDYRILGSLVATESNFKLDAVSVTGAKGLGQLKDATAEWLGVGNSFDPSDNLHGTAKYLSFLADEFPGDPAKAIASYFVGQGTVKRQGLNEGAINYIIKVQRYLDVMLANGAK